MSTGISLELKNVVASSVNTESDEKNESMIAIPPRTEMVSDLGQNW